MIEGQSVATTEASEAAESAEDVRQRLVPELRSLVRNGQAEIERQFLRSGRGLDCARALSALTDSVVTIAYENVVRQIAPAMAGGLPELAVVATGGYGRGTMAPGSDVDLLFLLPAKHSPLCERIAEAMLYILWDLKLKVGHATRTIDECVREAKADMTIRTSLLETRYILGNEALYDELVARYEREVVRGSAAAFVEAKLKERDARVRRAGASRYLVEPNVKDGKGGLRDLNTLFWVGKYVYRVHQTEELVGAGLFTADEAALFERCEEFLWRVRCHLHFVTGRPEERLTFDSQRLIADRMGFSGRQGQSAVERFMKAYFVVAKQVGDLTAIVCAGLEARQAKNRPVLDRMFGSFRRKRGPLESADFIVDNARITVRKDTAFEHDPVNLIRLFWLADRHNLPVHPDASRLATRSVKLITPSLRRDPTANRLFLDIVTSKNAPEIVLRRMNETGVLGRFIPDFGRIVAMMQFNMYHHYTVDEHLIRSIGVLAEIEAQRLEFEHPLANRLFRSISNRRALYVAVFLHDIAKGRTEDHSIAGAEIARKLGPRLGLDPAETDTAAWLVEHHLVMSTIAQGRDLSDPKTIEGFAAIVQSIERLRLLLVLTIADIKAVGPGVWTGWKGELLRTLFYETEIMLSGGYSERVQPNRVLTAQERLREDLGETWSQDEFDAYVARLYPPYWLKTEPSRRLKHALFIREMESQGRSVAAKVETDAFRGVTELTIISPDHPRLLAIVTGACAAAGGNIVDAQIFTSTDGLALDTISLSRAFEFDADEIRRAERIGLGIERALRSEVKIADLVAERRPPRSVAPFHVTPEVVIDNTLSGRHTVIEVSGLDRPGLLYDMTTALGKLNLNIASAHVATFGEKAVDVFYVTDLTGTKVSHPSRQAAIRRTLLGVFERHAREQAAVTQRARSA
jgi:[protein-PII] uridylyltransferase